MASVGDIAIVGVSFKMPQDAEDELGFWKVLESRKNVMTEWPPSRTNIDAIYDARPGSQSKLQSKGGHFLRQDPAEFDAPFFSITAREAAAMDPQHRLILEASYRAFENAGMPVKQIRGTRTAVFATSMSDDYARMFAKDPDNIPRMAIQGICSSILPNRLSWYFDLVGPSVHVDTACSSSMVALDLACQSLRNGDADMALVAGANLMLGPEGSVLLSGGGFLSPDSVCWSFDHRANGYARGEAVIVLVVKPVADAVRDGDMIRAVIRSTGSNQDGRTPGLTQPSAESQEQLIRHVYGKAGLDFASTRFFEAHGTGTPIGDPIEMKAIGRVFRSSRSAKEPLYVGSLKANFGHLEASSGLAGVVKAMLILEKGLIPPNALFEEMNPEIDAEFYHTTVPTRSIPWPCDGLRRVSVNSFGFGGTNSHVVIDDALHYLQTHGLDGNHCTVSHPPVLTDGPLVITNGHTTNGDIVNGVTSNGDSSSTTDHAQVNGHHSAMNGVSEQHTSSETNGTNGTNGTESVVNGHSNGSSDGVLATSASTPYRLLVWTAPDEKALTRTMQSYEGYYKERIVDTPSRVDELAYTLAARRSHHLWRTFALSGGQDDETATLCTERAVRASNDASIGFIFTGQGAQYAKMGLELIQYPVYEKTLRQADEAFRSLGCAWSIIDELQKGDKIDRPEYSQPLCTALQLALVELLRSFNIVPSAVLGHSSGEIAAAYAAGAITLDAACRIAYYRGQLAGKLRDSAALSGTPGAMLSANLADSQFNGYLQNVGLSDLRDILHIACVNSPTNSTVSGPEHAIDRLKEQLDEDGIFAQKLKTGVSYHSPAMRRIADEYLELLQPISNVAKSDDLLVVPMISSVTVQPISSPKILSSPQYWVDNLVSTVRFSDALEAMVQDRQRIGMTLITDLIEIGPHPALRRSVQDILSRLDNQKKQIQYSFALQKGKSAAQSILQLTGRLFCNGHDVSIPAANQQSSGMGPRSFLVDCPEYPFDHSRTYWAEPRMSREYRLRERVPADSLGQRSLDWNPLEPTWRRFLSVEATPWAKDHVVTGTMLYPGAGMIVMALEAAKQMCPENRELAGILMKEANFLNAMVVGQTREEATEVVIRLQPLQKPYEKESVWSDVKIFSVLNGRWTECFRATTQLQYKDDAAAQVDRGQERKLSDERLLRKFQDTAQACTRPVRSRDFYDHLREEGLGHGETFQLLEDIHWDNADVTMARVDVSTGRHGTDSLVHPAILDCALQLPMLPATQNFSRSIGAAVPSSIFNGWFAPSGWQHPQTSSVRILTAGTAGPGGRGIVGRSLEIIADDGSPLCVLERLVAKSVSTGDGGSSSATKLLHGIEWQPQLSLLSNKELARVCEADNFTRDETAMAHYRGKLNRTLDIVVRKTVKELTSGDGAYVPDSMKRHMDWMEYYVQNISKSQDVDIDEERLSEMLQEVDDLHPPWKIYPVIARNISAIMRGETDPLHLVFGRDSDDPNADPGLADMMYRDVFTKLCDDKFRKLLNLMTHEQPTMRIIEVGAGTGGATRHVLSALGELESRCGGVRFADYTYTDISPAFFETARAQFQEFEPRMNFRALDLQRPPAEQGFGQGTYDVVIAGSVLHATEDLTATMAHVRSLLKPGGHLILIEVTAPESVAVNFAFGTLPGWWGCKEEWRRWCPAITEEQWDQLLRDHGFVGNRLVLRDYESTVCHDMSVLFSTLATESAPDSGRLLLLVPDASTDIVEEITSRLHHRRPEVLKFDEAKDTEFADDDIVLSLLEMHTPFLASLTEEKFGTLQDLIKGICRLMWVSVAGMDDAQYPDYGLVWGFLRSMRSENIDKQIITLSIEHVSDQSISAAVAEHSVAVFAAVFEDQSPELEFWVRDGRLETARLVEEEALNTTLRSLVSPQVREEAWRHGPALKLTVSTAGFLDSLEFVEDEAQKADLGPYEVEVEAKAWGLSFRDVFVALGRLDGDELGYDFAGVVTCVGSACDASIQPGDRVCGSALSCMRTYPRSTQELIEKIPDSLSFEAAASFVSPGITAYYSLIDVARLRKGEKILIQSASGSTGQMAIWIAQMIGAEVFATVGFDEKKQLLIDEFGIPADHIFYSRNTTFAQGIMRVTNGYGVDVVLNSLSGDGLRASWECIAAYGRFIEIGKADITSNSSLPMGSFARNVSFAAVDLFHVAQTNQSLARSLLKSTIDLISRGIIQHPKPIHVYPASAVEQAFRYLQSGKNTGRIVISVDGSDVVRKRLLGRCEWTFDENASYLIVGGLGGLGRAIISWMARKGAKNLIVMSRSGADSSRAAADVINGLRQRGLTVAALKCDVSDEVALSTALAECAGSMPPIKGCINAAMVLQDAVFGNMTHAQWALTIRSKVATSWNLDRQLPRSLDFFVLLSSLNGIYGGIAQSNYAAGCTFQDALARMRVSRGEKAVSFDVGWMRNIGIIAETPEYQAQRKVQANMGMIEDTELLALLDMYCDPCRPVLAPSKAQLLIGAVTPADVLAIGQSPPPQALVPLFATFSQPVGAKAAGTDQAAAENYAVLFRQPGATAQERAEVVVRSLVAKLARALSIAPDDVDIGKHLSDYGVDSLMAVELRNWITKDFGANVAIFEIMGGTKIRELGELVVEKSGGAGENTVAEPKQE